MKKTADIVLILIFFLTAFIFFPGTGKTAQDYESFLKQGREAFKGGNYNSAELLFRKAIDSEDDETRDRAWYYLARSIFEQKNYQSALYEFNSFLNKCKTSEICLESRFWIGETFYRQNEFNRAIDEYKRFISNTKNKELAAKAHDRIAMIYYGQERFDESALEWNKAVAVSENKKSNAVRLYRISDAFFRNERYNEALQRLKPLLTSRAEQEIIARARILSGHILYLQNNPRRSLIILNGIPSHLIKKPPFNEAQYFKALCYLKLKQYRAARSLLEMFIMIGKDSQWHDNALYELGMIHYSHKRYDQCIKILKQVIENSKEQKVRAQAARVVGTIYFDRKPADSIRFLEFSLPIAPDKEKNEILFMLGKAHLKIKNYEKAGEILNRFIKRYPFYKNIDEVKFSIARVYLEKGEVDRAVKMFQKIREENPFSDYIKESRFYLAVLHYQKKEYKKAENLLYRYLREGRSENRYETHLLLLKIYVDRKMTAKASQRARLLISRYGDREKNVPAIFLMTAKLPLSRALKKYFISYITGKFPSSKEALSVFIMEGDENFKNKKYKKAEEDYSNYLANGGTDEAGRAFFNRIQALYHMGKYKDAIKSMKKKKFPPMTENQWRRIPYILSRCHYALEEYDQVYNLLYNKNKNKFPPDIVLIWIRSSYNIGDPVSARSAMKLFSEDKQKFSEALYHAGMYHMKKAETEEALGYFSRVITETPGTKFVDLSNLAYAKIHFSSNRYKKAIERLESIKDNELKPEATAYTIMCYFNIKNEKKAVNLTRNNIRLLLKSRHGEMVLRANLEYFYRQQDIGQFKRYAALLARFKGNRNHINYRYAKLYLARRAYKSAYYYFYKLTLSQNDLWNEALYNLAMINLHIFRKKNRAVANLKKLIGSKKESDFYYKAQLELAIIYYEKGEKAKAGEILSQIAASSKRKLYAAKAENIILHYNLNADSKPENKNEN